MTYELVVEGLYKSFGAAEVLRDVGFTIAAGSTTAIVGPSGCGKTTLLRLIAGFERPTAGRISIAGREVSGNSWVPAHRRGVGYVAQDGALFPHLDVRANIGFGLPRRQRTRSRISELLAMVSLDESFADRRPDQLSGGQQQRIALARALAREPGLMLLDEPFSALDAGLRASTRRLVSNVLDDAGITTILVTHDQQEALSFADQVAVMSGGRLAQIGAPRQVYSSPVDIATAKFLGDAVILPARIADGGAECVLGRVAVPQNGVRGTAQVMLRPEQIRVSRESGNTTGTVTAAEYLGSSVVLRIRLDTDGTLVTVRQAGRNSPEIGDAVSVTVLGEGVVYPAQDEPALQESATVIGAVEGGAAALHALDEPVGVHDRGA